MHALRRAAPRAVESHHLMHFQFHKLELLAKSTTSRVFHVPLQEVIRQQERKGKGRTRTSERGKTSTVSWPGMPAGICSKDLSFCNDSSMKNTV